MLAKVILFLALVGCCAAAIDNCKKGGDYCQNHWDCCSNTCLTYLYKCSQIKRPQVLGNHAPVVFAPPAIPTAGPQSISLNDLIEIVFRPLERLAAIERDADIIESRLGLNEPQDPPTTPKPVPVPCLAIGAKCYFSDECCSQRCHGFLHQCVT